MTTNTEARCVNHCGHDESYVVAGVCIRPMPKDNRPGYEDCGHVCVFPNTQSESRRDQMLAEMCEGLEREAESLQGEQTNNHSVDEGQNFGIPRGQVDKDSSESADCHNCGGSIWRGRPEQRWFHVATGYRRCRNGYTFATPQPTSAERHTTSDVFHNPKLDKSLRPEIEGSESSSPTAVELQNELDRCQAEPAVVAPSSPTEATGELPTPEQRDNESLVQLLCESYGRSLIYANDRTQHDLANTCKDEVLKRLVRVRPLSEGGEGATPPRCYLVEHPLPNGGKWMEVFTQEENARGYAQDRETELHVTATVTPLYASQPESSAVWRPIEGAKTDGSWYVIARIVNGELLWWYKSRFTRGCWRTNGGTAEPTHYLRFPPPQSKQG